MADEQRTTLSIYNIALAYCKSARLYDENDGSTAANECNTHFPRVRRRLLRLGKPNFACKQVTLTKDATAPEFGYSNRFLIPADCLAINVINRSYYPSYRVVGRYIHTDESELQLEYTFDETVLRNWDATYYEMLAILLAKAIVLQITEDMNRIQIVDALYKESKVESMFADASEGDVETTGLESDWLSARNGIFEGDRSWLTRAY